MRCHNTDVILHHHIFSISLAAQLTISTVYARESKGLWNRTVWSPWRPGEPEGLVNLKACRTWRPREPVGLENLKAWRTWQSGEPEGLEKPKACRTWRPGEPEGLENLKAWGTWRPGDPTPYPPWMTLLWLESTSSVSSSLRLLWYLPNEFSQSKEM